MVMRKGAGTVEECVAQVREELANPEPNNPGGFVFVNLSAHAHIALVSAELTYEERKRVRFRVPS